MNADQKLSITVLTFNFHPSSCSNTVITFDRLVVGSVPKYVDVLKRSSASSTSSHVPTSLFNVMPSSQSSPAIFSPGTYMYMEYRISQWKRKDEMFFLMYKTI